MKSATLHEAILMCNHPKLSNSKRMVMAAMADYAAPQNFTWVSAETIARNLGRDVRNVRTDRSRIVKMGLITKSRRLQGEDWIDAWTFERTELDRWRIQRVKREPAHADGCAGSKRMQMNAQSACKRMRNPHADECVERMHLNPLSDPLKRSIEAIQGSNTSADVVDASSSEGPGSGSSPSKPDHPPLETRRQPDPSGNQHSERAGIAHAEDAPAVATGSPADVTPPESTQARPARHVSDASGSTRTVAPDPAPAAQAASVEPDPIQVMADRLMEFERASLAKHGVVLGPRTNAATRRRLVELLSNPKMIAARLKRVRADLPDAKGIEGIGAALSMALRSTTASSYSRNEEPNSIGMLQLGWLIQRPVKFKEHVSKGLSIMENPKREKPRNLLRERDMAAGMIGTRDPSKYTPIGTLAGSTEPWRER